MNQTVNKRHPCTFNYFIKRGDKISNSVSINQSINHFYWKQLSLSTLQLDLL